MCLNRTARWLSLSTINSFQHDPALCTGMRDISLGGWNPQFYIFMQLFYWRQMHFLSRDYAAGSLYEWRPHCWQLARSKTWLFCQPFKHFIWVGFYQRKNTGSVDNHGIVMNPRKTQYFWVWAIRSCLAVLVWSLISSSGKNSRILFLLSASLSGNYQVWRDGTSLNYTLKLPSITAETNKWPCLAELPDMNWGLYHDRTLEPF